ncbi:MAG: cytochrome d ubiquinol oxidase subunit II [Lysobacteraceae bacterium]|nr:MAG: cytochrome d ubiquinol oxidase subunit II [Xanthomonadaceae bacterium]
MNIDTVLPVAWFAVIAFGVMMYVLLDGFVLGLGILAPFAEDEAQLDHMMNTAAPIWDGNETWLVLGGAGLLAAFPKVYALVLSSLYLPVLLMLIALVFRGVAFEFRFKAKTLRRAWGLAFWLGSVFAAFAQGLILGAIVEGMPLQSGKYVGGSLLESMFGWFSPFSMLTGIALLSGYALLGASWLILKTDGRTQNVARMIARPLSLNVFGFIALVSAWLPFLDSRVMARWFESGHLIWLAPVPLLVLAATWMLWRTIPRDDREAWPFMLSLALFLLGFIGLLLGMWPHIVPPSLTIWDAAAPPATQGFALAGLIVLLPVILGYTWWSYRVFRGKIAADAGYH